MTFFKPAPKRRSSGRRCFSLLYMRNALKHGPVLSKGAIKAARPEKPRKEMTKTELEDDRNARNNLRRRRKQRARRWKIAIGKELSHKLPANALARMAREERNRR